MRTIGKLFIGDVRRLTSNIVSIIIVIGLTVIPGLFTWFNIAASWDPFSNMKNLKFAVASVDEGYRSDLIPMKITMGDQILNTLRTNSELDWTFTDEQDAIKGTKSGKYYAAIVIPKSFSKSMMTFFSSNAKNVRIRYYTNEKTNALTPNLTNQGANEVSTQINQMFVKTLTGTALSIASQLSDDLSSPKATAALNNFTTNIGTLATTMQDSSNTIGDFSALTTSASTLLNSSSALLKNISATGASAGDQLKSAKKGATDLTGALDTSTNALATALKQSASSYDAVADSVDSLVASAGTQMTDTAQLLNTEAKHVSDQAEQYQTIRNTLAALEPQIPDSSKPKFDAILSQLETAITMQDNLATSLKNAAADVTSKKGSVDEQSKQIKAFAAEAKQAVNGVSTDFSTNIKPTLSQISTSVANAAAELNTGVATLKTAVGDVDDISTKATTSLDEVKQSLDKLAKKLSTTGTDLAEFNTKLETALNSSDLDEIRKLLGTDSETLAASIAAPVKLKREAVFPVAQFGSSLAPLYVIIPLWVGALLMAVTLKTTVSHRTRKELRHPRPHQMFLGHYGVFALIALMQSTFSAGGSLLSMHVQAVHPWLFMLTGWVSSLVFSFFAYTMVVSFGNVGKAIGVLMLIMQISGSNAAYPLQMLPSWLSAISPFLPATHAVTALRASIAGIYDMDYWKAIGALLLFIPPLLLIGLVLRKPLIKFNQWYVANVESTKLIA